jgi:hypothetical protein
MKKYVILLCMAILAIPAFSQRQGIKGKVEWITGNQMPGPGVKATKAPGIKREIYIYGPTTLQQTTVKDGVFFSNISTKLIAKKRSKKNGKFCVKLPPGEYSVFVKEADGLFANQFDGDGRIQCITVKNGEFLPLAIKVNYTAAY